MLSIMTLDGMRFNAPNHTELVEALRKSAMAFSPTPDISTYMTQTVKRAKILRPSIEFIPDNPPEQFLMGLQAEGFIKFL